MNLFFRFFCQNLKSQKSVLLNNLVIRGLNFVINANILGIAKRPHMEDYEFSKFQQKFCKFKSKFKHYKKKVPICFIKVHNLILKNLNSCFIYDFIVILNHFVSFTLSVTEKRTYLTKGCLLNSHLLTVLLSIL